ncbi:hypothetical protein ROHU_029386 [Labeo rohita]|uniref:Uncharacterized protein n=1 Tax=Labeo rohita TaxID=84645 RepID=A0A498LZF4_LABRO|nr:hypothetical protein ROHU_029386 [Labeo rohita]
MDKRQSMQTQTYTCAHTSATTAPSSRYHQDYCYTYGDFYYSNVISAAAPGRAPLVPAGLSCQREGALAPYVSLMSISSLFHLGTYRSS